MRRDRSNYNPSGNVTEDVNDTVGTNAKFDTLIENVLALEDIAAIENGHSFDTNSQPIYRQNGKNMIY